MSLHTACDRTLALGIRHVGGWRPALLATLALLLLAGCSVLGGKREPATIYAPDPQVPTDPAWPSVDWQLTLGAPSAARLVDSHRISVRPSPGEIQIYKGVRWARTPTEQVEEVVLHALEDSGKIPAVGRQETGIAGDYKLVMDLRRFEADYAGNAVPAATIEVNAKLLHSLDQEVVATRTFLQAVPSGGTDTGLVAQAFGQALESLGHDIAGWTLASGQAHQRDGRHAGDP